MVSPTTRLAAWRARSATSPRSSARARCFSASISPDARTRIRSSSSRVAAMSASRVSWATFCARPRMSFASRRASVSAARRSVSALSRSLRACSASRMPCSIRSRRAASMPLTCFPNARYRMTAKTRKLSDATAIQKKLIARPPASAAAVTLAAAPGPTIENSDISSGSRSLCGGLQDDGQDRDDDREDAKALREGGAEDELRANLRRCVGVAADRRGGEAGQDPDADAGADDAQRREARSDEFHVFGPSISVPRVHPAVDRCSVVAALVAWCTHAERRRDPTFGHVGDAFVLLGVVALHRDDRVHQHERREDQCLHEVEQALEEQHPGGDERDGERGDDAERHLAAEDVAEQSHCQRDGLDELEQELDEADEQVDDAARDPLLEAAQHEE